MSEGAEGETSGCPQLLTDNAKLAILVQHSCTAWMCSYAQKRMSVHLCLDGCVDVSVAAKKTTVLWAVSSPCAGYERKKVPVFVEWPHACYDSAVFGMCLCSGIRQSAWSILHVRTASKHWAHFSTSGHLKTCVRLLVSGERGGREGRGKQSRHWTAEAPFPLLAAIHAATPPHPLPPPLGGLGFGRLSLLCLVWNPSTSSSLLSTTPTMPWGGET